MNNPLMDNRTFVEVCRMIARIRGTLGKDAGCGVVWNEGWEWKPDRKALVCGQVVVGSQFIYADEKVAIFAAEKSLSLEIVIREGVTESGLQNPVVMVKEDGTMFRWHGEVCYIRDHIRKLLKEMVG